MKSKVDDSSQRVLVLLKLDAKNLFVRLKKRRSEYISIFALKRNREHFKEIFYNRYDETTLQTLTHCNVDIISALDSFYSEFDELRWYLNHTEDMPVTVEDTVVRALIRMERNYQSLQLYIDAELGIDQVSDNNMESEEISSDTIQDETP